MAVIAEKFVDFFDMVGQTEWTKTIYRSLIHWIGVTDQHRVLDAGCGAGHLIVQLAQRAAWVEGIDLSDRMIERARFNAKDNDATNVSLQVADIRNLPYRDGVFDIIICTDLFFLFDSPESPLRSLLRVCNASGQVVIVNPAATMNPWSAKTYCENHRLRDFERDSLLAWATASAKRTIMNTAQLSALAERCGAKLTDTVPMLEGVVSMYRIIKE